MSSCNKKIGYVVNNKDFVLKCKEGNIYKTKGHKIALQNGIRANVLASTIGTKIHFISEGDFIIEVIDVDNEYKECQTCSPIVKLFDKEEEFLKTFESLNLLIETGKVLYKDENSISYNDQFDEVKYSLKKSLNFESCYQFTFYNFLCTDCKSIFPSVDCERSPHYAGFSYIKLPFSEFIKEGALGKLLNLSRSQKD